MNNIRTKKRGKADLSTKRINKQRQSPRGTKKAVSTLDPNQLIKKATYTEQATYESARSFDQFPIDKMLKANILKKGFTRPTEIQEASFDHLLAGRDLLGVANTGTGKTGAFLIPIIEQLLRSKTTFTSLVVLPTRELALQVEEEFKSLTKHLGLFSSSFIGGTNINRDLRQLQKKNHLIIGTPGRLMDLFNRRALNLKDIQVLVLDEFDRMLDMGFINDIKKIVSAMTSRKQTMLFSATVDKTQEPMIKQLLHKPVEVKVSSGTSTSDQIEQDIIRVPEGMDKFNLLLDLIGDKEFEKVLVFAETKRMVNKISKRLSESGVKSDMIHGNKSQNYRNTALDKFKRGSLQVLVATDVAARGIDVSDVTHVINYQLPMTFDSYVHRIGRTGRAGKLGKAFTFVD